MDRASLPGSGERTKRTEKAGKSKDWKSKKGGEASRAGRAERRILPHSSSSPVFYKVPVCLMRHEINSSTDRHYLIAVIPLQNSVKSMAPLPEPRFIGGKHQQMPCQRIRQCRTGKRCGFPLGIIDEILHQTQISAAVVSIGSGRIPEITGIDNLLTVFMPGTQITMADHKTVVIENTLDFPFRADHMNPAHRACPCRQSCCALQENHPQTQSSRSGGPAGRCRTSRHSGNKGGQESHKAALGCSSVLRSGR